MSAKKTKKAAPKGKKKPSARSRDRRTNITNAVLIAMFALGVLALLVYAQGWYLPAVSALSTQGYDMNAVTFNYFYRDCYDSFQNAYGEMLAAQGTLDSRIPLDEQTYSSGYSWADFFYDTAVENAKRIVTVYLAAQSAGYTLPEETVAEVDSQLTAIKTNAKANGYSTAGGFLRGHYGKGATMESYREYLLLEAVADGFSGDYYNSASYSDGELADWFAENYPDAGDAYDYHTVNFRLIYFPFSGYAYDEATGYYGYSEESRSSAMSQLQYVSTLYVQGEQTEESFAALAAEYSSYKAEDGGLYENALKTDDGTEAQVLSWVFAGGRSYGDVDYVEADSGVYLLYWVGEDMPAWELTARKGLRSEAWNAWYGELSAAMEFDENPHILKHVYLDP